MKTTIRTHERPTTATRLLLAGTALCMALAATLVGAAPAHAAASSSTSNEIIDITTDVYACTEYVRLTGPLHVLFHMTVDGQGGMHVKSSSHPQGVIGVGLTSGDTYRGTGVTQNSFSIRRDGLTQTYSYLNNFRIIGQGTTGNYQVHETMRMVIDASGQVTVSADSFRVTCS